MVATNTRSAGGQCSTSINNTHKELSLKQKTNMNVIQLEAFMTTQKKMAMRQINGCDSRSAVTKQLNPIHALSQPNQ